MTLPIDEATLKGALYSAAKKYPGGIDALAKDMDARPSTLYAKLRGEKGYPLDLDEAAEILGFLRGQEVEGWPKALLVLAHRLDHLAFEIPRAMREAAGDELQQISEMMQEVADIAHELAAATDETKADGKRINSRELKRIELACDEAMEKIAATKARYRARYLADKKKGLVK